MKDIEFGLWTAVAIQLEIAWVMGPSVSTDQFVVRCFCFVITIIAAVVLKIHSLRNPDRISGSPDDGVVQPQRSILSSASGDEIPGSQE